MAACLTIFCVWIVIYGKCQPRLNTVPYEKMDKKRAAKYSGSFSIWLLNLGSNQGPTD